MVVTVEPVRSIEELAEVRTRLRKLNHDRNFLDWMFHTRDKQLFPRDLLVACVPTRRCAKSGGRRPVGILRRTLKYDKKRNRSSIYIDFVWVMEEQRGRQVSTARACRR